MEAPLRQLRQGLLLFVWLLGLACAAHAEVVRVTVTSRQPVANGQAFGTTGPYERLAGTIEFALDPVHPRNRGIANLGRVTPSPDGRVHFTSSFYVLQPVNANRGNGVLLFEVANRGRKGLLGQFNYASPVDDPIQRENAGDGYLMREGYTLVWIGWEFDVPPPALRVEAPLVSSPPSERITVTIGVQKAGTTLTLDDAPGYAPAEPESSTNTLACRDHMWSASQVIARSQWKFVPAVGAPQIQAEQPFKPGQTCVVTYRPKNAVAAGVGFAAVRDAAAAFKSRNDLPVRGRWAIVFGVSQSGRFLRQFLGEGFNATEGGGRAFDGVWAHVAGAAQGSFNEAFAMPRSYQAFVATKPPFVDVRGDGHDKGLQDAYTGEQRPRVFYTNSSSEYWVAGRAAALTHTSPDSRTDVAPPDNVRRYFFAGAQHGEAAFPPRKPEEGEELANPTPQRTTTRALLRALRVWVVDGVTPPPSRYPRLADGTLVPVEALRFPAIPGVRDPRTGPGPQRMDGTKLPFLVPQVDADGNELGGIRVAEAQVPLATVTGWNFANPQVWDADDFYPNLGSYLPFARTSDRRTGDPRRSIAERYPTKEDYVSEVRAAAERLIAERFLLPDDLRRVIERAERHWAYAVGR